MSSDLSMMSDEDMPLAATSGKRGANGLSHVVANGGSNGHSANGDVDMSDDDDVPLSEQTRRTSEPTTPARPTKRKKQVESDSSSDDDTPLAASPSKPLKSAAVPMPGAAAATTIPVSKTNGHAKSSPPKSKSTVNVKDEDDSEDDEPLAKMPAAKTNGKAKAAPKGKVKVESDAEDSDDNPRPSARRKAPAKKKRKVKSESDADEPAESSEEEKPLKKRGGKASAAKKVKKEEDVSDDEVPPPKKRAVKAKKEEDTKEKGGKKGKAKKEAEDGEEEVYKWWEMEKSDGTDKWQTLVHNGVYFPPPYEPLPKNVKMKYNGKPVDLPPESEEVAGFYAVLIETDHAKDDTFNKNFFKDWQGVLKQYPPRDGTKITDLARCDFRPMFEHFEAEKARKKALTTAEKKELKAAKDKLEEPYATCTLDGRKEKVGNFRVEPPSLFRGRGEHPKKGSLKLRVHPEDITINIAEGVPIPKPNVPGQWKKVVHDKTVTWLATWTENINNNNKYVFLAAGSTLKGQSDMAKFEKARDLKNHVDRIRADYTADLVNKVMADRQRATAMYFIDRLALRAGNEKGEDEADTVGCCSLRCEHVTLEQPNFIIFDFLGKDSIRYYNRVAVEDQVFKNIRIFKKDKNDDDDLFDRVSTTTLNKHLQSYMKGLTAKVFRTYNASSTFQDQLDNNTPENATLQEKLNAYNKANRMVAILCNHQRSVPKTHDASMGKMRDRVRALKYEKMKLRHALITMDPKYKKQQKYKQDESDIDDEWIEQHEENLQAKDIERAEKKFAKDNEKAAEEGKEQATQKDLDERIKDIKNEYKRLAKERGTGKATLKRERAAEKLEEAIQKLEEKITNSKLQMVDREEGKEVALSTSKINYLDPRITAAWCKEHDVPIEKLFSKTLLNKFPWALQVEDDWKF